MAGGVLQLQLSGLGLNGSVPALLGQLSTLSFVDVSRNMLSGTLPPQLGNISSLQLSVFDNNLTGTVPSAYTSLSFLAASYNPSLYGTWPTSVPVGVFYGGVYYVAADTYIGMSGSVPYYGSGCSFGTSLGLSAPMYTILQAAAAALDPSGAQLPSWRTPWQPCPPYSHGASQNSSSPMVGRSWAGVVCQESSRCTPSTMIGGLSQLQLSSLGLNGTIACGLSQLSTATTLDLRNNSLTGYIPISFGGLSPLFSLTTLTALYLGGNQLVGSLPWTFGAC